MLGVICAELFRLLRGSSCCYGGLCRADRGIEEIEVVAMVCLRVLLFILLLIAFQKDFWLEKT
jgi:hypothetical protein